MQLIKTALTMFAAAAGILSQSCTADTRVPAYANIGYEGAQLYADASGKQTQENRLAYGEIIEFDANDKSRFVKVRNIATGVEGYVDTISFNKANYPLEAPYIFDDEQSECSLLSIETTDNAERISGWTFWKSGDVVAAFNSVTSVYDTGRMFTQENYYIGEAHPGYIILTQRIEYGEETGEKLETPIVIYEDIASRAGIFEGGACFTPGGQPGCFDTDDWE